MSEMDRSTGGDIRFSGEGARRTGEDARSTGEGVRPPEFVLDELAEIGRSWIAARARERAVGPISDTGKGTVPTAREDLAGQDRVMQESADLRERFRELAREFVDRVEEL